MKPLWVATALFFFLAACGEEKKPYQAPVPKTPATQNLHIEPLVFVNARRLEQLPQAQTRIEALRAVQQ